MKNTTAYLRIERLHYFRIHDPNNINWRATEMKKKVSLPAIASLKTHLYKHILTSGMATNMERITKSQKLHIKI